MHLTVLQVAPLNTFSIFIIYSLDSYNLRYKLIQINITRTNPRANKIILFLKRRLLGSITRGALTRTSRSNLNLSTPSSPKSFLENQRFSIHNQIIVSTKRNLASHIMTRTCDGSGCHAEAKLRCPKCITLEIDSSFCSQNCFKSNWSEHKLLHFNHTGDNLDKYNPWPGFEYTGKLRPYPRTGPRKVPDSIQRPDYADHPEGRALSEENIRDSTQIKILKENEIESMKVVCRLAREVLDEAAKVTDVGITTDEIDRVVHEASIERDCYPSPLNYYKFPKSCCTSVNEVICHGIPDKRPLEDGDIVNIDITVYHKGFHGDLSETLIVGNAKEAHRKLVQVTWECLQKGIELVKPGVRYREIGDVIQKHASLHGFSVVKSYCGHGINRLFHTAPKVPHYANNKAIGVIQPGHTFTIEPMIAEGSWRDTSWPDDWTAVTVDGLRCAQFEETLLATETGCELLTRRRANKGRPYFMDKTSA